MSYSICSGGDEQAATENPRTTTIDVLTTRRMDEHRSDVPVATFPPLSFEPKISVRNIIIDV